MALPNIAVRGITGVFFIIFLLAGILFNSITFFIVFGIILILGLNEFYGLMNNNSATSLNPVSGTFCGILLFFLIVGHLANWFNNTPTMLVVMPYIFVVLLCFISELYARRNNPISALAYFTLGQVYVAVPFLFFAALLFNFSGGTFEYIYLLSVFVLVWVNDTFAYLTGRAIGRTKMFERISPKKTWEGFFGGAIFAILASYLICYLSGTQNYIIWAGFAIIITVFGTLGDLIESLFKRTLNIKDSGTIIPGHGGILDRFDSVIFAAPAVVVYMTIVVNY